MDVMTGGFEAGLDLRVPYLQPRMPFTDAQVEEEQAHFANVISTFQQYAPYAVRARVHRDQSV